MKTIFGWLAVIALIIGLPVAGYLGAEYGDRWMAIGIVVTGFIAFVLLCIHGAISLGGGGFPGSGIPPDTRSDADKVAGE